MEKAVQSEIIKWLKGAGCYVVKTKAGMGTPVGCPDIIFLYEGAWGVIECKAAKNSKFQPGQQSTLQRLRNWSPFCYVVYPENWPEVKAELQKSFF
jgi:Holliday junction resolvase